MRGAGAAPSTSMASAASAAVGRSCGFSRRQRRTSARAPSGHSSGTLQGNRCSSGKDITRRQSFRGKLSPLLRY